MLTNHFCKCDKCGASRSFNNRPFEEILKVIRAAGWRVTKNANGWHHYCPECVAKRAAARKSRDKKATENEESTTYARTDRAAVREPMWWQRD